MSFSEDVRNELTHTECAWECCARAELATAICLTGGVAFRGANRYGLTLSTAHNSVSRYYFALIKRHFGIACEIHASKRTQLGERVRYQLIFPDACVDDMLDKLMLRDPGGLFGVRQTPGDTLTRQACCRAALLKSALMIAGSVSGPEKAYSLSVAAGSERMAGYVCGHMRMFDLNARVSTRKHQFVAYLKGAEDISALLTIAGAHSNVLSFENTRILKQLRNDVNRVTNCDNSNIERVVTSAQAQLEDIRLVLATLGRDKLPDTLLEIAEIRLSDPNATLTEMGEMCAPRVGKSGVNNRLRRISELARKIREDNI